MKLRTANCNINALKILAVSEFYGLDVEVEISSTDGKISRSTKELTLRLQNGYTLFSSNAICRFLIAKSGKETLEIKTDEWMEWESSVLQPDVAHLLLDDSKRSEMHAELLKDVQYLNAVIDKQAFLSSKNSFGIADIVVWSTLYPLFGSTFYEVISKFSPLLKWFNELSHQMSFQNAISRVVMTSKTNSEKKAIIWHVSPVPPRRQRFYMPVLLLDFSFEKTSSDTLDSTKMDNEVSSDSIPEEEIASAYNVWLKGQTALPALQPNIHPRLPKKGDRNILITSALPYVNNVPHLGNIIGAVLSADVFARYCRLRNYNALYICGTDEYGTATETKAIEEGITPKEICDKYNRLHTEIYKWFNISFDYFGRTTTGQQTKIAQDIFLKLYERQFLHEDTVEQLYCEMCKRFLADRFVEGICPFCAYEDARGDQCDKCGKLINAPELKHPQCKVCRNTPHLRVSKHLFLDLPKLEPKLKEYLDKSTNNGYWSNTAKVISYSWIKDGLKPRCITRDLKWGTPVPLEGFTDKVFYVWYDAPIGYLSITANYTDQWEQWWKQPDVVQLYQFMAKDNVPFHSIIFPACQLGTEDNYTIVNHLVATEYLNYEDVKFSKSRGIGVFGDDARDTGIPSDIWRFYLLYLRPENQDTYFSWSDLMLKNNSELLNNLGNFINRALMFISNNFDGIIPEMNLIEEDKYLLAEITRELLCYINCMERTKLRDGIKPLLNISRLGNQYIQSKKPWELIKGTSQEKLRAGTVLGVGANISCLLCTLLEPYMPDTSAELRLQLNTLPEYHVLVPYFACLLSPGHKLGKPKPLFKKIDAAVINSLKEKYAGRQSPEKTCSTPGNKSQNQTSNTSVTGGNFNGSKSENIDVERLTAMVSEQGNKVRQLKSNKASKSEIDKEVAILLDLKKKIGLAVGDSTNKVLGNSQGKNKKR